MIKEHSCNVVYYLIMIMKTLRKLLNCMLCCLCQVGFSTLLKHH